MMESPVVSSYDESSAPDCGIMFRLYGYPVLRSSNHQRFSSERANPVRKVKM